MAVMLVRGFERLHLLLHEKVSRDLLGAAASWKIAVAAGRLLVVPPAVGRDRRCVSCRSEYLVNSLTSS